MEFIKPDPILEYHSNTLVNLRNKYNYGKPGEMDSAINVFENWIKKQDHFTKKDYSREYLERSIILLKGSIERAKLQMDKICTMRTLLPKFFEFDFEEFKAHKDKFTMALLPKLTEDNYRLSVFKFKSVDMSSKTFFILFKFGCMLCGYMKAHDYCDGIIGIIDYRGLNLVELVSKLTLVELHQAFSIGLQGFQLRVKSIHIVTESNTVNVLLTLLRQVFSKKIFNRITVHKSPDTLYSFLPKEILTSDFGGRLNSTDELYDDWLEVCKREENVKYFKEMANAQVIEALRPPGKFNELHMGLPGSFRSLNVD